ncbi:hypothetical protein ACFVMC_18410 [Nocardia sp. NPDC127579]|uniref:hypothetical protein n=1 Tax=Nocardia sp. NPDC127579 TaxID=3345402 RepID=UPI0036320203
MTNLPPEPYPGGPEPYPGSYQPYGPVAKVIPSTVQNAFYAMLAGAVVTVLSTALVFTQVDAVREQAREQQSDLTAAEIDAVVTLSIVGGVIVNVIAAGLWILLAFMCRAGKNWARITASVLFGVNTVFSLMSLVGAGMLGTSANALGLIFTVLLWLIGLGAIVLLWLKPSGPYFQPAPPMGQVPPMGFPPPGQTPGF